MQRNFTDFETLTRVMLSATLYAYRLIIRNQMSAVHSSCDYKLQAPLQTNMTSYGLQLIVK